MLSTDLHIDAIFFNRVFLACYFTFVALFYTSIIVIKKTKTKKQPVNAGIPYSLHWFNHKIFGIFRVTIWLVCTLRLFNIKVDNYLGVISTPTIFLIVGDVLLIGGLSLAIFSTMNMKNYWRSGIDNKPPQYLITSGIFSFSRNPNFLGVGLAQLGFFLALPSIFSLVCLVIGWVCINIQVRLEEKHLQLSHGDLYSVYCLHTSRWVNLRVFTSK